MNTNIYKMNLHESFILHGIKITRVAGGWIYKFLHSDEVPHGVVFVPYNNEFQGNE